MKPRALLVAVLLLALLPQLTLAACTAQCSAGQTGCFQASDHWETWACIMGDEGCYVKSYSLCTENQVCSSGACVCDNKCSSGQVGCFQASDHWERWSCTQASDSCYIKSYADCQSGQVCADGACATQLPAVKNGQSCASNARCESGNCQNGICCAAGKTCCSSDTNCQSGQVCSQLYNYCMAQTANLGESCTYPTRQCASGLWCDSGLCCEDQKPCCAVTSTQAAANTRCRSSPGHSLGNGWYCDAAKFQCVMSGQPGDQCTDYKDCYTSWNLFCEPVGDSTQKMCCYHDTGRCCNSDSDCASLNRAATTYACDLTKRTCVLSTAAAAKKANGQSCTANAGCESGRCSNGYCCASGDCCASNTDCQKPAFACSNCKSGYKRCDTYSYRCVDCKSSSECVGDRACASYTCAAASVVVPETEETQPAAVKCGGSDTATAKRLIVDEWTTCNEFKADTGDWYKVEAAAGGGKIVVEVTPSSPAEVEVNLYDYNGGWMESHAYSYEASYEFTARESGSHYLKVLPYSAHAGGSYLLKFNKISAFDVEHPPCAERPNQACYDDCASHCAITPDYCATGVCCSGFDCGKPAGTSAVRTETEPTVQQETTPTETPAGPSFAFTFNYGPFEVNLGDHTFDYVLAITNTDRRPLERLRVLISQEGGVVDPEGHDTYSVARLDAGETWRPMMTPYVRLLKEGAGVLIAKFYIGSELFAEHRADITVLPLPAGELKENTEATARFGRIMEMRGRRSYAVPATLVRPDGTSAQLAAAEFVAPLGGKVDQLLKDIEDTEIAIDAGLQDLAGDAVGLVPGVGALQDLKSAMDVKGPKDATNVVAGAVAPVSFKIANDFVSAGIASLKQQKRIEELKREMPGAKEGVIYEYDASGKRTKRIDVLYVEGQASYVKLKERRL